MRRPLRLISGELRAEEVSTLGVVGRTSSPLGPNADQSAPYCCRRPQRSLLLSAAVCFPAVSLARLWHGKPCLYSAVKGHGTTVVAPNISGRWGSSIKALRNILLSCLFLISLVWRTTTPGIQYMPTRDCCASHRGLLVHCFAPACEVVLLWMRYRAPPARNVRKKSAVPPSTPKTTPACTRSLATCFASVTDLWPPLWPPLVLLRLSRQ